MGKSIFMIMNKLYVSLSLSRMTYTSFSCKQRSELDSENKRGSNVNNHLTWGTRLNTFHAPYLFDQVPGEAVIGGELQADLSVNVRGGLAATAHDQ